MQWTGALMMLAKGRRFESLLDKDNASPDYESDAVNGSSTGT